MDMYESHEDIEMLTLPMDKSRGFLLLRGCLDCFHSHQRVYLSTSFDFGCVPP